MQQFEVVFLVQDGFQPTGNPMEQAKNLLRNVPRVASALLEATLTEVEFRMVFVGRGNADAAAVLLPQKEALSHESTTKVSKMPIPV